MKKIVVVSLWTVAAVILFSQTLSSKPVPPVRTLEIPKACIAPTLDGLADSYYSVVQTTNIYNPTGYEGESDFTAQFRVCWNPTFLFVLAEITDDIEHCYQEGVGNSWEFDNFEIFLQLDTNTVITTYSPTTVQLRFNRGADSAEMWGHADRSDFAYYMESNASEGWTTELAIPWTAVLPVSAAPEEMEDYFHTVIGFEFSGADSDNSDGNPDVGNRDVQTAWDEDDGLEETDNGISPYWNNTSIFGYVTLHDFDCSTGIEDYRRTAKIKAIPNPANENIRFKNVNRAGLLTLYNLQGVAVLETEYHPDQELDISGLKSGMYTVVIDGMQGGRFIKH